MQPNPHDPRQRTDLTPNERTVLRFMDECLHGDNLELIDELVAEDYIQHTPGIGQGRDGIRRYFHEVASKRPGRRDWRPVHLFACGDFVILHKLLPTTVIVDILRFNAEGKLAEHWDVVQRHPEPGYDPMKRSEEDLSRFAALFAAGA
ncbi:nuclear transport factor 2 family protein [Oceanicella sp. SM1341]|uniref:nuclear transport factor 2 family protein n=1 Tax=Oceanicella sp. SM1341 TaxID=1548889 RepID=UPI000E4ED028|nr:nuclear transport factor 2 family protein [Oceanicella sp. SM1341]